MFQPWHRQLKARLSASLIQPLRHRGQPYAFCMGAGMTEGEKKTRGFSSYPPYLTVLNTSALKHTGTDNKIYVLKVKSCKSGFGSLGFFFSFFFFWLMQIRERVVYVCEPALGAETSTLKNLYILIAFTCCVIFPTFFFFLPWYVHLNEQIAHSCKPHIRLLL